MVSVPVVPLDIVVISMLPVMAVPAFITVFVIFAVAFLVAIFLVLALVTVLVVHAAAVFAAIILVMSVITVASVVINLLVEIATVLLIMPMPATVAVTCVHHQW